MEGHSKTYNTLKDLLFEVYYWHRRNLRKGNHATLNKRRMIVSGRKPWRQKGTGRARAGGFDSPLWVGGAVAHGPQPRDYSFNIPKRKLRKARLEGFKIFEAEGRIKYVDYPQLSKPSTKEASRWLVNLFGNKKVGVLILVGDTVESNLVLSFRNLQNVQIKYWRQLSAVDFIDYDYVVCSRDLSDELRNFVYNYA